MFYDILGLAHRDFGALFPEEIARHGAGSLADRVLVLKRNESPNHYSDERLGVRTMSNIVDRLIKGAAVLQRLEKMRLETGTPRWGYDTEYEVVNKELSELEDDILRDPGGLERQLVRVRRSRKSR